MRLPYRTYAYVPNVIKPRFLYFIFVTILPRILYFVCISFYAWYYFFDFSCTLYQLNLVCTKSISYKFIKLDFYLNGF